MPDPDLSVRKPVSAGTVIRKDDLPVDARLKITEIFYSLQGEALTSGVPTVFVRLTGCPLRCQYCDTEYAFHGGTWSSFDEIVAKVRSFDCRYVCVTGGEPLAQKNCAALMQRFCDEELIVSVETSGACDISVLDPRVVRVMDLKTPDSGEVHRNRMENLTQLQPTDQVKFVLCSREDFVWAANEVKKYQIDQLCTVLFSPSFEQLNARDLANWILEEQLPVRLQLQLHKLLWGDGPGR